ncbi:phosphomevalonate kinase [Coemansia erecta]|uniref:Phosphomevalonate kinase n=1 Tax=Coemansia asiatica TaxID=1052880 RepID=A0A9W7XRI9_9FUNG|nr:phosphomevalonate kinase [Coemansia asiatica]KAJ2857054.1 phosphomevalonate kinase [Coemansia erecta]KAJ2881451.1 phosphomevalonate kinase [Coemansia asiatica]
MPSPSAKTPITLVSAPGKVLVVGGYLVLDRAHSGLVVGTDACLYAAVQTESKAGLAAGSKIPIFVHSPQFESAWWKYTFDFESNLLSQEESADNGTNGFVQVVLQATLGLVNQYEPARLRQLLSSKESKASGLKIVLLADNDFYSQRETLEKMGLDLSSESLKKLPSMCKTGTTLRGVHKTGLGSSAAMVTSLVGSLLSHFGIVSQDDLMNSSASSSEKTQRSLKLIHNVAQYTHCLAQGKVGSGFDVSAAVYGSHVYRRFSPAVLDSAMAEHGDISEIKKAVSPKNPGWDSQVVPVSIPPRFILRLADVDAGSNTPSMVRSILQWKKSDPERATAIWDSLDKANNRIRDLWAALVDASVADGADYNSAVDWCAKNKSSVWKSAPEVATSTTHRLLAELVDGILNVRALQRLLGENAQVPIEPAEQTRLLDACMEVPGVCMAAVPGAGGYDAIFCVTLGQEASAAVADMWAKWTEMSVGPLLANQASSGVRILDPEQFSNVTSLFN